MPHQSQLSHSNTSDAPWSDWGGPDANTGVRVDGSPAVHSVDSWAQVERDGTFGEYPSGQAESTARPQAPSDDGCDPWDDAGVQQKREYTQGRTIDW
ncbi:hypothetical protein FRB99_002874, partial [Tulasnella sp. 403]